MKERTIFWIGILVLLTGFLAVYATDGFHLPAEVELEGDAQLGEMLVKSISENGPIGNLINNRLGAPERSTLVETPFLDWIYVFEIWIITFFIKNPGVASVVFLWVSYILASLTMFYLMKKLKFKNSISFVFALLFSFSTFHSYRGIEHGTLSNYFLVPISVLLALYIATDAIGEGLLSFGPNRKRNRIWLGFLAFFFGFTNIYFIAFGLIVMVMGFLYRIIKDGLRKAQWKYLIYPGLTLVGTGIALAPKILFTLKHGETGVAVRNFMDGETYGLRLIQMLLPALFSKLEKWTGITAKYMSKLSQATEACFAAIGLIAVAGFLFLCGYFIVSYIKRDRQRDTLLHFSSLCVLVCVLTALSGGFGTVFNFFVTGEIRSYNRITIYIICFCLLAVASLLQRYVKKPWFLALSLVLLCAVGWADQVKIWPSGYWEERAEVAENYQDFYSRVEASMEEGAMVYQLPFVGFPEQAPLNELSCYEPLSAYVYTDTLKWSHGGMWGRNMEALYLWSDNGISRDFVRGILEQGFQGVCINLKGYKETEWESVIGFYSEELGLTPTVSQDGMLYFYDIRQVAD
jgi:phosphoglycerol transferase